MKRITLATSIGLAFFLATASPARVGLLAGPAQNPPSQSSAQPPHEHSQPNMHDMMKMHEKMMGDMKAADAKLDQLVTQMNAATREAKIDATAAVVAELVRQQKAMHEHMGQMHQQMMGGHDMMMKK